MLDDEARRTLEEEAIALVSLSNPTTRFMRNPLDMRTTAYERMSHRGDDQSGRVQGDSKALLFAAPCRQYAQQQDQQPQEKVSNGAIHPMLQVKANLIARRDGKMGTAPTRKLRIKAESGGDNPVEKSETQGGAAFLSMEVFVNSSGASDSNGGVDADLKLAPSSSRNNSSSASTLPPKRAMSHAGEELYAQNPAVSEEQQQLDALNGNISMKSLLVTLKKRKLSPHADADAQAAAAESERAKVLPSFREVFESPRQPSDQQTTTASSSSDSPSASSTTTTATPTTVLTSAELKCKYRTGKCSNMRALKSCGDYHNLCNYHRLRANANQRKLDRKKKVQRQQTAPSSPQAAAASLSSSPASVSAASALCAPSAAAAAALVAMPTSAPPLMPFHQQQFHQQRYDAPPPPFYPGAGRVDSSGNASSSSTNSSNDSNSLRVKQERSM